jgi:hypothetical protein
LHTQGWGLIPSLAAFEERIGAGISQLPDYKAEYFAKYNLKIVS